MKETATATFAGGCFWCIASAFDGTKGVEKIVSGYMGGDVDNPSYELVCTGQTGHAEVVRISYDPDLISYDALLAVFFRQIDPTDKDGSFMDRGSQYRSAIFYHTREQKQQALDMIQKINDAKIFKSPVVTEVIEASQFFPAETYHQDYHKKNPAQYKYYQTGSGRQGFITRVWDAIDNKIFEP